MSISSSSSGSSSTSSSASPSIERGKFGLKFKRFFQRVAAGYRVRVEIEESVDMPPEVFRYVRHPPDPQTGEIVDRFEGVCSLLDMEEFQAYEPSTIRSRPCLRLSYVDVVRPSLTEARDLADKIDEELCLLVTSYGDADVLEEHETILI